MREPDGVVQHAIHDDKSIEPNELGDGDSLALGSGPHVARAAEAIDPAPDDDKLGGPGAHCRRPGQRCRPRAQRRAGKRLKRQAWPRLRKQRARRSERPMIS